jgi:hypothetical protein
MIALLLFIACTGANTDSTDGTKTTDSENTGPGTLAISFQMEEDLIPSMDSPPVGTFYGSIYAEADATPLGQNDGAISLEDFSATMDLSDHGGPTEVLFTTQPLEVGVVWLLGCLDLNADDCGDPGDPITIPSENKALVVAGTETAVTIQMNMLRP